MTVINEDAVYKGKTLHVAEFLSTFQGFFRRNDAERKGPISVEMIEEAIEFRRRLHEHYNLENKVIMLRKDGTLTDSELQEWQESVESSKASIEATSATIKAVHELLRRFEVWSTQALANQVLTHCVKDNKGNVSLCCSPVLNLPGAAHFFSFLAPPSANSQNHVCALGVPANAWNWQEYLRLCNMVSLLQNPEEAMKSTVTAASSVLIGQRNGDLKMSESSELTPADLVALWTRAQRNTSGLLHLMHLFKVTEAPDEPRKERYSIRASGECRGKMLVVQEDEESEEEEDSEPRYVAEYIGNHKKTRKHVVKCSAPLDKLVEWAVTNQALFTYRYIRESMPERLGVAKEKSSKKRPSPVDDVSAEQASVKRRKVIRPCENEEDEVKLFQACECFLLRWFGKRNRKVISILFTSKLDRMDLFPYNTLVQQLLEHNIPNKVKKVLKRQYAENTNRTFSRVDRRIRCGNFDDEENHPVKNFRSVVVLLLKALAACTPEDVLSKAEVLAACNDFERLHDTFLLGKTAAEAAELLLDMGDDVNEEPANVLLSFVEPWEDHCSKCTKVLDDGDTEFVRCDSCSKTFHVNCGGASEAHDMSELIKQYPPLAQLDSTVLEEMKPEEMKVWRCASCHEETKPRSEENRIFTEAIWCKALIRDLGMEYYALPFHDEGEDNGHEDDTESENSRHSSLRRLDAMMDYISVQHHPNMAESLKQQLLDTKRNPFLSPPVAGSSCPGPIEWVTEPMMRHPMQLLCKGVEMIMLSPGASSDESKDCRTAFLRRFASLFGAWFLCTHEEPYPMQPSGALPHSLAARVPWVQDSCIVCCARPVRADEPASPVCFNEYCQQLHSSGDLNEKRVEDTTRNATTLTAADRGGSSAPGAAAICFSYDELSSLVGSPILVLPGDPMLQFVSKELLLSIDHMDRPMFFIVASYLPRQFAKSDKLYGQIDDEGIFHVVPVLSVQQLKYLHSKLAMRRPPEGYIDSDAWTRLEATDLEGVVRMSTTELRRKLKETAAIREAVDSALSAIVATKLVDGNTTENAKRHGDNSMSNLRPNVSSSSADLMNNYSALIDCLLRSQNPFVRDMIGALCPVATDDDVSFGAESDSSVVEDTVEEVMEETVAEESSWEAADSPQPDEDRDAPVQNPSVGLSESTEVSPADKLTSVLQEPPAAMVPNRNENMGPLRVPPQLPGAVSANQQPATASVNRRMAFAAPVGTDSRQGVARHTGVGIPSPANNQLAISTPSAKNRSAFARPAEPGNLQVHHEDSVVDLTSVADYISEGDLYQPGLFFWTRVESAFYLEACERSLSNLGLRLLCPRYSLDILKEQSHKVFRCDLSQIPKVQGPLWDLVIGKDYDRAKTESGPFVLQDESETPGDLYQYRLPVMRLPLDRITEGFLAREKASMQSQPQVAPGHQLVPHFRGASKGDPTGDDRSRQPSQANRAFDPPVNRIRGGGPSDEGLFEVQHDPDEADEEALQPNANEEAAGPQPEIVNEPTALTDLPRNEWQDTPVYLRHVTTMYGEHPEEAVAMGIVQELGPEHETHVPVALFYFSNHGYPPESTTQELPAALLLVVQNGSDQQNILERWEGYERYRLPRRVSDDQMDVDDDIPMEIDTDEPAVTDVEMGASEETPEKAHQAGDSSLAQADQMLQGQPGSQRGVDNETSPSVETVRRPDHSENEGGEDTGPSDPNSATDNAEPSAASRHNDIGDEEGAQGPGGDSEQVGTVLAQTPKDSWVNSVVYSKCETTQSMQGDDTAEATFIGVVQSISDMEDDHDATTGGDEVTVALFYLSNLGYNRGYLPEEALQREAARSTLSAESLYVVQEGSIEDEIAKECIYLEKLKVRSERTASRSVRGSSSDCVSAPESTNNVSGTDASGEGVASREAVHTSPEISSSMKEFGKLLTRKLCQRKQGPAPIGQLPDGRAVLWVQSDPRALYIRMFEQDESRPISVDRNEEEGTSCPWGCGPIVFHSVTELQDHLRNRHDFGQLQNNVVTIEDLGSLFRIPEGQIILTLSAQLATAVCAQSQGLSDLLEHSSSVTRSFRLSDVLDLTTEGQGSPQSRIVDTLQSKTGARSMLQLWSRLARMFAVESTGLFRMDAEDCETLLYFGDQETPSRMVNDADALAPSTRGQGCMNEEKNSATSDGSSKCNLCRSRWDCRIRTNTESSRDDGTEASKVGGAGCDLLCLSCRPSHLVAEGIHFAEGTYGLAGVARSMLIRIASSVPPQLRRQAHGNGGAASTETSSLVDGGIMWQEGNYQSWRYLVERSHTVGAFLQLFVVLVHSLQTAKLPRWWTGAREGSHCCAFATMASATHGYPALLLRLYALDAALAESLVPLPATLEDCAPKVLRRLSSVERRMEIVQKWGEKVNYKQFDGNHKSECLVCKDGGDLVCCQYCSNTAHPSCCVPKISDPDKLKIWVCPSCVNDLAVFVGADDEED